MAKVNIPTIKLNNGLDMPALGYGTWLGLNDKRNMSNVVAQRISIRTLGPRRTRKPNNREFDTSDVPKLVETLEYAIDIGYRHIDTAHLYRVEPEVGETINRKIKEGVVKREDLFVVTKVWQHFHREKDVEVSVKKSLERMKMDYLDLVLMHWPMAINEDGVDEKIDYLETWRGFEAVLRKGLAKSIGVSNFNVDQLKRLIANSKVVPSVNQVEINVNLGQTELVSYCQGQKIVVVAYSPFGTMVPSRNYPNSPQPKLDHPTMVALAKKYRKTVTQIVLRYLYERRIVSIPKTVTKSRVLENASIFDFELEQSDISTLAQFNNGFRTVRPVWWQNYEFYPFDKVPVEEMPEIPLALIKWKNGKDLNID